jgi:hypothetical protein
MTSKRFLTYIETKKVQKGAPQYFDHFFLKNGKNTEGSLFHSFFQNQIFFLEKTKK